MYEKRSVETVLISQEGLVPQLLLAVRRHSSSAGKGKLGFIDGLITDNLSPKKAALNAIFKKTGLILTEEDLTQVRMRSLDETQQYTFVGRHFELSGARGTTNEPLEISNTDKALQNSMENPSFYIEDFTCTLKLALNWC